MAVWYVFSAQQKTQDRNLAESTRAFALLVENELQTKEGILLALANSPSLAKGDLAEFYRHARTMAAGPEQTIVLFDTSDRQLLNTRLPFGAQLPARRSSNIPELVRRIGGDRPLVSDLFFAPVGQKFDFNIQVPVKSDGRIAYFLAMGINASTLQNLLARQSFPASWTATIVDRNGVVVARSRDPEHQVGKLVRDHTRRILASAHTGIYDSVTLDGIPVKAFFNRVPNADWSVLLSIPKSEIRELPLRAAAFLAGAMIVLMGLAAFAAHWFARRAFGAIEGLSDAAERLGQEKEVSYTGKGIREIDGVGNRIADASIKIRQATAELEQRLENEMRHASLLAGVAAASRSLNTALSVEDIANILVSEVRGILRVHLAIVSLTDADSWSQAINAVSMSDKFADYRDFDAKPSGEGIYAEVCKTNRPMRLTQAELESHPRWEGFGPHAGGHVPLRGWMAVPLVARDGKNMGLIQVSDKEAGDFTEPDEAILMQLASIAATGFENARLYDSLREQDRRKDEFLAMLAHELRNPLAPISAAAEMMELVQFDADRARQTSEVIARQVRHMVGLVDDLLDVSRVTRGLIRLDMARLDACDAVHDAVEQVRPLAEAKHHRLTVQGASEPVYLSGDRKRLVQILTNLLNNAAKYTPEGGDIQLRMEAQEDRVRFTVTDNGIGISPALQPHIFELFSQAQRSSDRSQGGLGIGLALVKSLVELHGGSVACQSDGEHRGSRFVVSLPRTQTAQPGGQDPVVGAHNGASAKRLNILVVDDNADAANMLAMYLKTAGHHVEIEYGSRLALERAQRMSPDVCILDIGLPEMDGYELARRMRALPKSEHAFLIAVTGYGREQDRRAAFEAGFDRHFVKPVNVALLAEVLQQTV